MKRKFLIKSAWNHIDRHFGSIIYFIATPVYKYSEGLPVYDTDEGNDIIFVFKREYPKVNSILQRLETKSIVQWVHPSSGEKVEEEFELNEFTRGSYFHLIESRDISAYIHKWCYGI